MEKTMDATQQTFPLLNGKPALLSHFLSLDPTLKSHPQRATGMHGLPIAVGGSLASAVPRSVYILLPAPHRAALEGFYSPQLPPPTPTSAPHRPANDLAGVLGLADRSTTTSFTEVLEAVRGAPIDALAEVLVLCPAASPAIQRLLFRRVRAPAAVQSLRADDAAEQRALPDDGDESMWWWDG